MIGTSVMKELTGCRRVFYQNIVQRYQCDTVTEFAGNINAVILKNLSFTGKKNLRVNNTPMIRDTEKLRAAVPWAQDVNGTYIRRSEDLQDVHVRSIHAQCFNGPRDLDTSFRHCKVT